MVKSKKRMVGKIVVNLILVLAILIGGIYFFISPKSTSDKTKTAQVVTDKLFGWKFPVAKFPLTGSEPGILDKLLAYSSFRDPGGIAQGLPVRLKIPVIGVDSAIEDAHITPDGRMDVPAGSVNVAWFALGPHPGQVGSAVIGGHFGINNGVKFVFYDLDKVKIGNKIFIVDDKNDTLAFQVKSIKSFDRNADATTVFTSTDGIAHLNLITCEGTWNQLNGSYPLRLVVFADAIPGEGSVSVPAATTSAPKPTIAKPKATPTLIPTATPTNRPTPTPVKKIITPIAQIDSPAFPQTFIEPAQNLYSTPTNAVISSLLILSIVFIAFQILKG